MKAFKEPNKKHLLLGCLFIVFIFLRLFLSPHSPTLSLAADNLKYMELARVFPHHQLYNHQLYLLHPPGFPYAIHFVDIFIQKDYISVKLLSILSSIAIFFILYFFLMRLTKNFYLTYLVLTLYSISVPFIISANSALKESFVLMLILLTLFTFIRGIQDSNKPSLLLSSLFGGILALTSDHVIFIFPALVLSYLFFNSKEINIRKFQFPKLHYLLVPLVIILTLYGGWNLIKYYQYSHYDYYPNGTEGTPVGTKGFGLIHLINPQHFEDWSGSYIRQDLVSFTKKVVFQIGYMFNIEPFSIPLGLNFNTMKYLLSPHHVFFMILVYVPLALAASYGFYIIARDFFRTKKIHNNVSLYMLGLFFIFLLPITQQFVSPRYIFTSYLAFFYIVSLGMYSLLFKGNDHRHYKNVLIFILTLFLLIPFWALSGNTQFVLTSEKFVQMQNTANWINNNLEKDAGIMAQPGYGMKIIYLTNHRTVGLYPQPEKLMEVIDYYDIDYVVFGRFFTYDAFSFAKESAEFIKNNNEDFELIATIKEDYSQFFGEGDPMRDDEVYIYKVKKPSQN